MAGIAIIGGFEWAFFRGKSYFFRKKHHPTMAIVSALGFGLLLAALMIRSGTSLLESMWIIPITVVIGIVDALKRQICTNCGYEANGYGIDGFFEKNNYCPKCGKQYNQTK